MTDDAIERFIIANAETPAERRRYALLQSATQIMCGLYGNDEKAEAAVLDAEWLLEIIERRETKQEPQ